MVVRDSIGRSVGERGAHRERGGTGHLRGAWDLGAWLALQCNGALGAVRATVKTTVFSGRRWGGALLGGK